jgi:hypothetical protein
MATIDSRICRREDAICMQYTPNKNKDTHPQSLLSHGKEWLRESATLYVKCAFPLLFIYKYQSSKVGKLGKIVHLTHFSLH